MISLKDHEQETLILAYLIGTLGSYYLLIVLYVSTSLLYSSRLNTVCQHICRNIIAEAVVNSVAHTGYLDSLPIFQQEVVPQVFEPLHVPLDRY